MKLIAKIEKRTTRSMKSLTCRFPADSARFMYERVLNRNLGERPYSEMAYKNGPDEYVVVYFKETR